MSITRRTVGFTRRGHGSESDFRALRSDQSLLHADVGAKEFGRDYRADSVHSHVPVTRLKKFDDRELTKVMQALPLHTGDNNNESIRTIGSTEYR